MGDTPFLWITATPSATRACFPIHDLIDTSNSVVNVSESALCAGLAPSRLPAIAEAAFFVDYQNTDRITSCSWFGKRCR